MPEFFGTEKSPIECDVLLHHAFLLTYQADYLQIVHPKRHVYPKIICYEFLDRKRFLSNAVISDKKHDLARNTILRI